MEWRLRSSVILGLTGLWLLFRRHRAYVDLSLTCNIAHLCPLAPIGAVLWIILGLTGFTVQLKQAVLQLFLYVVDWSALEMEWRLRSSVILGLSGLWLLFRRHRAYVDLSLTCNIAHLCPLAPIGAVLWIILGLTGFAVQLKQASIVNLR
ncbi:uncharacterized protein BYT42DRAFT_581637 [Radiomyces spectabilis]|uniref:uncharacterized protein n=1 Tax=Radiomyces spectabilis TaxID=64574 RepID=UPI00221F42B3|nr:uncharacterized protein BYT42DRAFT_581637 [Radiomyces spectabilis]KAI8371803.1 hypothetical protein BYT42DRAFT_581637 [Radiomyces spectabilis]